MFTSDKGDTLRTETEYQSELTRSIYSTFLSISENPRRAGREISREHVSAFGAVAVYRLDHEMPFIGSYLIPAFVRVDRM